ncbi:MAG: hypothetical protein WAO58_07510 [Fimbriimonadaceae bacterium]
MRQSLRLSILLLCAIPSIGGAGHLSPHISIGAHEPAQKGQPQEPQPLKITTSHVIAKPGTKGWKASKVNPLAFAKKVDAAMKSLSATLQQVVAVYAGQKGSGQALNTAKILDGRRFAIQYFNIDTNEPFNGEVRSDGNRFSMFTAGSWSRPVPLSTLPRNSITPVMAVRAWPLSHPKMMYTGILFKADIWSTLVKGYQQGLDGYKVAVEERTMKVQNITVRNLRIVATRSAAGTKKFGPATIELLFDANRYLPVTVRVHMQPKKDKKPTKMSWQSIWKFNQVFKPVDFFVPTG